MSRKEGNARQSSFLRKSQDRRFVMINDITCPKCGEFIPRFDKMCPMCGEMVNQEVWTPVPPNEDGDD